MTAVELHDTKLAAEKLFQRKRIIGFGIHGQVVYLIFDMKCLKPHAFGFVGAVAHPQKAA